MQTYVAKIENVTNSELVEIYNELADRPIKKFSDSAAAQRRVQKLLDESGMVIINREGKHEPCPKDEAPKRGGAGSRGPKPIYSDNCEITVLSVFENEKGETEFFNPKRKVGAAHARFELYRTCKTVAEYLDAAVKLEKNSRPRFAYRGDIQWDVQHGFISVVEK